MSADKYKTRSREARRLGGRDEAKPEPMSEGAKEITIRANVGVVYHPIKRRGRNETRKPRGLVDGYCAGSATGYSVLSTKNRHGGATKPATPCFDVLQVAAPLIALSKTSSGTPKRYKVLWERTDNPVKIL